MVPTATAGTGIRLHTKKFALGRGRRPRHGVFLTNFQGRFKFLEHAFTSSHFNMQGADSD
jgi:hypothetical protein